MNAHVAKAIGVRIALRGTGVAGYVWAGWVLVVSLLKCICLPSWRRAMRNVTNYEAAERYRLLIEYNGRRFFAWRV